MLKCHNKLAPEPSLLQAEQPQLSQPVLTGEVFHSSDLFCDPPLDPLQQVHVFAVLRAPGVDAVLQVGPHQSRAAVISLNLLTTLPLMQPKIQLAFQAVNAHCCLISRISSTSAPESFSAGLLSVPSSPYLYGYWELPRSMCGTLHLAC